MIERKVDFEHGERAVTHYKVVEEKNGHSLVSLILETGRTHQIRVHMQYLGFPLVGDYLYNPIWNISTVRHYIPGNSPLFIRSQGSRWNLQQNCLMI